MSAKDSIGNVLVKGQLVQIMLPHGDTYYGFVENIEEGGLVAATPAIAKNAVTPSRVTIRPDTFTIVGPPNGHYPMLLAIKNPNDSLPKPPEA